MKTSNMIGGILLVSGTTIGGGILALPTATINSGFYPTILTFCICWFFMTIGALLLLEVGLWSKQEANLISMAGVTIGTWGKVLTWVAYLMLLFALISAYLTASGAWLVKITNELSSWQLPSACGAPIIAIITGISIYFGTYYTDRFNRVLAFGLFITFIMLIAIGFPHIDYQLLNPGSMKAIPLTIPLMITSFGFAIIVPSLCSYLDNNDKALFRVIMIGSLIPLVFYILWEMVMLGILSIDSPYGLKQLAQQHADGTQVAVALENVIGNKLITGLARFFSIFAILTSLIGVALSLFHFLADGLKLNKQGLCGVALLLLTFAPPLIAIYTLQNSFNAILSFGGVFVAVILGLLPALMVWYGRDKAHMAHSTFKVFGGKPLLVLTIAFFVYVILQELAPHIGWL